MSDTDFPEQFAKYQNKIYAYILSLQSDWDTAEEIFQNTCVVLLRKQDQFDPQRRFLTWACGIAHNELRNYLRKERKHATLSDEVMTRIAIEHERADAADDSRITWLQECVEELPPEQRRIIERCYLEKTPVQELAAALDMNPNTLSKRIERTRRTLFDCITLKAQLESQ